METIKFNVDELLPRLQLVSSVINGKSALPILDTLLFESTDDGIIKITSSDNDTWLTTYVDPLESTFEGSFCINAQNIASALRNLVGSVITLEVQKESNTLKGNYENGHFSIPYEDADAYPKPDVVNKSLESSTKIDKAIKGEYLANSIAVTDYAVGNDVLRPVMNGIHFDFFKDGMFVVATDGHKMVKHSNAMVTSDANSWFTLPSKPAKILKNVLSSSEDIYISYNESCVRFMQNDFRLITRLQEGRYPNYNSVIPTNNNLVATLPKEQFVAALKRVLPMGSSTSELVVLLFENDSLTINAEDIDFATSAKEIVECAYNMQAINIGFKGSVLLQVVQNIKSSDIVMAMSAPEKSALFMAKDSDDNINTLSLLMPMLIN